jgi:hypothetical protein
MSPTRRLVFAAVIALSSCKDKQPIDPEPPAAIRSYADSCENVASEAVGGPRITAEREIRVKGLSLWHMRPCHRPVEYVWGSDTNGAVVKSVEVFCRFWDESPKLSASELADKAIYVLGKTTSPIGQRPFTAIPSRAPRVAGRTLTFVTSAPREPTGLGCTEYVIDATARTMKETDVTSTLGATCDNP